MRGYGQSMRGAEPLKTGMVEVRPAGVKALPISDWLGHIPSHIWTSGSAPDAQTVHVGFSTKMSDFPTRN
jgi:hypothetical protein